ncbi:hypothetical protein PCANC_25287 [Puccinia coronata f. sp. avenae]|uniref:Uncharacterized protein n=1 Tax=Puccinia coronata f. sp. avenae TaxID=200324 RepID=A0A2N5TTV4_9BASI|nr:hypothetical protein PCASD_19620 [Puccinia coronata f. sp. avenae]PLW29935.1 hypothetical protein PCANC_25287 [Puccinia coronata f. sp. avenae]
MSSHLRNGKDLWFEQQIVAKTAAVAAAARDQQRAKLQPAQHGADELKASAGAIAQNQLNLGQQGARPSFEKPSSGVREQYSFSPAALERLCRAWEQFATPDGVQRVRSAGLHGHGVNPVRHPLRNDPIKGQLTRSGNSFSINWVNSRSGASGTAAIPGDQAGGNSTAFNQRGRVDYPGPEPYGSWQDVPSSATARPNGDDFGRLPHHFVPERFGSVIWQAPHGGDSGMLECKSRANSP